jgi:hypothetical protein
MDYKTLTGDVLQLQLSDQEACYWARLVELAGDIAISVDLLVEAMYSSDNPMLDVGPVPGRGFVTKAVFERPVYRACLDLLERKNHQLRTLDEVEVRKEFSVTAKEAAAQLGITVRSAQLAMTEGRLRSVKLRKVRYTTPAAVEAYKPGPKAGRKEKPVAPAGPVVRLLAGSAPGWSMMVKTDGVQRTLSEDGKLREIEVTGWTWIRVRTNNKAKDSQRAFLLTPQAGAAEAMSFGPFRMEGEYQVAEKANNIRGVLELWKR